MLDLDEATAPTPSPRRSAWVRRLAWLLVGAIVGGAASWGAAQLGLFRPTPPPEIPITVDRLPRAVLGLDIAPTLAEGAEAQDIDLHRQLYGGSGLIWRYGDTAGVVWLDATNGILPRPAEQIPQFERATAMSVTLTALTTATVVCGYTSNMWKSPQADESLDLFRARILSSAGDGTLTCTRSDYRRNFSVSITLTTPPAFIPADRAHSVAHAVDDAFEYLTS